jgi:predicted nuclease with TOPRIM domain
MKPNKSPKREEKDGEVQKLKRRIKRLETDKSKLQSQVNTLKGALRSSETFLKGSTGDHSLEDLIEAAKLQKPLKQLEEKPDIMCPRCEKYEVTVSKMSVGDLILCKNKACGASKLVKRDGSDKK